MTRCWRSASIPPYLPDLPYISSCCFRRLPPRAGEPPRRPKEGRGGCKAFPLRTAECVSPPRSSLSRPRCKPNPIKPSPIAYIAGRPPPRMRAEKCFYQSACVSIGNHGAVGVFDDTRIRNPCLPPHWCLQALQCVGHPRPACGPALQRERDGEGSGTLQNPIQPGSESEI